MRSSLRSAWGSTTSVWRLAKARPKSAANASRPSRAGVGKPPNNAATARCTLRVVKKLTAKPPSDTIQARSAYSSIGPRGSARGRGSRRTSSKRCVAWVWHSSPSRCCHTRRRASASPSRDSLWMPSTNALPGRWATPYANAAVTCMVRSARNGPSRSSATRRKRSVDCTTATTAATVAPTRDAGSGEKRNPVPTTTPRASASRPTLRRSTVSSSPGCSQTSSRNGASCTPAVRSACAKTSISSSSSYAPSSNETTMRRECGFSSTHSTRDSVLKPSST